MGSLNLGQRLRNKAGYISGLEDIVESAQNVVNAENNGSSADRFQAVTKLEKDLKDLSRYTEYDIYGKDVVNV